MTSESRRVKEQPHGLWHRAGAQKGILTCMCAGSQDSDEFIKPGSCRMLMEASSCRQGWWNHWLLVMESVSRPSATLEVKWEEWEVSKSQHWLQVLDWLLWQPARILPELPHYHTFQESWKWLITNDKGHFLAHHSGNSKGFESSGSEAKS